MKIYYSLEPIGSMDKRIVYLEDDGNIDFLKEKTVAIIGYGNQGRSQALNLKRFGSENYCWEYP